MRPYKVANVWVDLDTIQSISEPKIDEVRSIQLEVVLEWQHAFRDRSDTLRWSAESRRYNELRPSDWGSVAGVHPSFLCPAVDGEHADLVRIRNEVFKPFFQAWCDREPDSLEYLR